MTIEIDRNKYDKPLSQQSHGMKIVLHMPPNFIPQTIHGAYLAKIDCFEIDFHYRDMEAAIIEYEDEKFSVLVGRNTRKLLKIILKDIKKQHIDQVSLEQKIKLELPKLFEQIRKRFHRPIEIQNFDVSRGIIVESAENLVRKSTL